MRKDLLEIINYAVHILVGTLMFLLLGVSAVGIGLFADWLDKIHYNGFVHFVLKSLEYVIFFVDSGLLLNHVVKSSVDCFKKH